MYCAPMPGVPTPVLLALLGTCAVLRAAHSQQQDLGIATKTSSIAQVRATAGATRVPVVPRVSVAPPEPVATSAQDPKQRGVQLRAVLITKLAAYITTKSAQKPDTAPFVIAVAGSDAFGDAIQEMLPGKCVGKRKIQIVVVAPEAAATESTKDNKENREHDDKKDNDAKDDKKQDFDLLYLGSNIEAELAAAIVKCYDKTATPLVSERPGFAKLGGGLQLFIQDNKIKFEVNQESLKKQGLQVSPQLLKLSTKAPIR